jgi:hypothetical protein
VVVVAQHSVGSGVCYHLVLWIRLYRLGVTSERRGEEDGTKPIKNGRRSVTRRGESSSASAECPQN